MHTLPPLPCRFHNDDLFLISRIQKKTRIHKGAFIHAVQQPFFNTIVVSFLLFLQLEQFRHLKDEHNQTLGHNFRPVQPLGDREIWYNIDVTEVDKELDLENEIPYEGEVENALDDSPGHGNALRPWIVVTVIVSVVVPVFVAS